MSERIEIAGLTCAVWGPEGGPAVLALHGLTSTSEVWRTFAEALPGFRVIAPDLPGRGGSVDLRAEPGLGGHAAAVRKLAFGLGLRNVVVVGHSMGAFLAPLVAAALGERVRKVVLLDGGVAPTRNALVRGPVIRAIFTVQVRLMARRWNSVESFVDATEGKAVGKRAELRPRVTEWASYLLSGPDGHLRARIDADRLIADAVDTLGGPGTVGSLAGSSVPVHLIAAAHGKDDATGPFLDDKALAAGRVLLPRLTTSRVAANHLTMLFDPAGPAAVA